ncbi:hypothetical protein AYO21_00575 [Fonsecaea monophora]|uniref:BZIP domain-containing protein n=1 Tax=Fonsecaea monophora TaxID=254056 RepID=A0A177FLY8_9EURO|nr:hypothetical protein AYO21_00575 [Fonsecaea monophora]KAH0840774.1 hypothetical protein FOPE_05831 [Fonsecaea pedrosoi]OAG45227.1 hypothetical protein AYO21_00575 [Fonsecaea monophora]
MSDKSSSSPSPNWLAKLRRSPQPKAAEKTKPAEGGDPEPDAKARRREQVRRAQRTHRDRKATYVKTLEAEVAKLRARDSAHEAQLQACRHAIRRLKDLIKYHKIPLPLDLASDPQIQSPQATIELLGLPDSRTQHIRAHLPPETESGFVAPQNILTSSDLSHYGTLHSGSTSCSSDLFSGLTISDPPTSLHAPSIYSQATSSGLPPPPPISTPMQHPQGLGATQVGVDFVLALEHVCLGHHAAHAAADDGSGHELMLMSPIMWHSPARGPSTTVSAQHHSTTAPDVTTATGLPSGTRWSVPAVELEKLLDFSDKLSLDGEITPVEAWQRVRQHPNFGDLTRDGLEALKATLLPEVQCYG